MTTGRETARILEDAGSAIGAISLSCTGTVRSKLTPLTDKPTQPASVNIVTLIASFKPTMKMTVAVIPESPQG